MSFILPYDKGNQRGNSQNQTAGLRRQAVVGYTVFGLLGLLLSLPSRLKSPVSGLPSQVCPHPLLTRSFVTVSRFFGVRRTESVKPSLAS